MSNICLLFFFLPKMFSLFTHPPPSCGLHNVFFPLSPALSYAPLSHWTISSSFLANISASFLLCGGFLPAHYPLDPYRSLDGAFFLLSIFQVSFQIFIKTYSLLNVKCSDFIQFFLSQNSHCCAWSGLPQMLPHQLELLELQVPLAQMEPQLADLLPLPIPPATAGYNRLRPKWKRWAALSLWVRNACRNSLM